MKVAAVQSAVQSAGMTNVVTVRAAAASDRNGEATFTIAKTEGTQQDSLGNIDFMVSTGRNITVPVVRLDSEIDERVHLLKVDTQGHEMSVIKGAEGIIKKHGIDVIHAEFSPALMRGHGVDPAKFLQYMHDLGKCAPWNLPIQARSSALRPSCNRSYVEC
jgi:FkbM family methyltransferase